MPIDRLLGRARLEPRVLDDLVQQAREIQRLARQSRHRTQMRELQDLADQRIEAFRLKLDAIELPKHRPRPPSQIRRHAQASERRTQLVRHRSQQVLLGRDQGAHVISHRVEVPRQHAELIATPRELLADARLQIAGRERAGARLQALHRVAQVTRERPAHQAAEDSANAKQHDANVGNGRLLSRRAQP